MFVGQDLATLRDALGNKDVGSSGQAIQFLAAGVELKSRFDFRRNLDVFR